MYRAYHIEEGDSIKSIALKTNTDEENLRQINGNFNVVPGDIIVVPMNNNGLFDKYIVQKGDSIYAIATKYNVPYKQLLLLNGLEEKDYIYPNQEILVPKKNVGFYITNANDTVKSIIEKLDSNGYSILTQNENLMVLPDQLIVYKRDFN